MTITTDHPASSYGIPVILNDEGEPVDYAPGIKAARKALGLSIAEFASPLGKSPRTVEGWEQGKHMPPTESLYVIAELLAKVPTQPA